MSEPKKMELQLSSIENVPGGTKGCHAGDLLGKIKMSDLTAVLEGDWVESNGPRRFHYDIVKPHFRIHVRRYHAPEGDRFLAVAFMRVENGKELCLLNSTGDTGIQESSESLAEAIGAVLDGLGSIAIECFEWQTMRV